MDVCLPRSYRWKTRLRKLAPSRRQSSESRPASPQPVSTVTTALLPPLGGGPPTPQLQAVHPAHTVETTCLVDALCPLTPSKHAEDPQTSLENLQSGAHLARMGLGTRTVLGKNKQTNKQTNKHFFRTSAEPEQSI